MLSTQCTAGYVCDTGRNTARLYHGNYRNVLDGNFNLIFTSPPYNIGSKGPAVILGLRRSGICDPKSFRGVTDYADTLPEATYQKQQHAFLVWCSEHLLPGGVLVYNHKDRRKDRTLISPESWFPKELILADRVIWDRGSTHNHDKTQLWGHTEFLYVLRKADEKKYYFNNVDDGDKDSRSNLWRVTRDYNQWHNAPFPLKLAQRVVSKWCPPDGLVCDPYLGSGTTAVASLMLGRNFIGSEIKSTFYSKCIDRLKDHLCGRTIDENSNRSLSAAEHDRWSPGQAAAVQQST